jgi:hypothetical protein
VPKHVVNRGRVVFQPPGIYGGFRRLGTELDAKERMINRSPSAPAAILSISKFTGFASVGMVMEYCLWGGPERMSKV